MSQIIFRRKLYEQMLNWKKERHGTTALLIEGARRVGKSTLALEFARQEYESYLFIDFTEASREVKALFDDLSDLDHVLMQLQFWYRTTLIKGRSVIIFDEVQSCPAARQAIKTLVRDGRYDYIETGSLLSIKKNIKDIRIPSEETRLTLYPLDYEEFRWALGDTQSVAMLRELFAAKRPVGAMALRKLLRDFRLYLLTGGMPQAIKAYLAAGNLTEVDRIKREIIELYADDFRKVDPSGKATRMFYAIPGQLSRHASEFKVHGVIEHGRRERLAQLVQEMAESQVVLLSRRVNDPQIGLPLHEDSDRFRLYLNDTGLFVTLAFWDKDLSENIIYQRLLSDKLPSNLGFVYENAVAQMLRAKGHELFYHTWPDPAGHRNFEIDFLLSHAGKLCPVEVKSSDRLTHASLDAFAAKFKERIICRYLLCNKDVRRTGDLLILPVFMTMFL